MRFLACALMLAAASAQAGSPPPPIDGENFQQEILGQDKPVLLYFFNKMCLTCKNTAPVVECLSRKYADHVKIAAAHVTFDGKTTWIEERSEFKDKISVVPTFVFMKNGREIHRVTSGLDGDESAKRQKTLRCLIDLALLGIPKGESEQCNPSYKPGTADPLYCAAPR